MDIKIYLYSCLVFTLQCAAQKIPNDTIYGPVKYVREKVIFLTEKENPQLIYYNDYGHSGFMGPDNTTSVFYNRWFSTPSVYFINYKRYFDKKRRKTKETWFNKKDIALEYYRYIYDEKDRIISEIDSTEYHIGTRNYYYTDYGYQNIIYESREFDLFSHNFKLVIDGKLLTTKRYEEHGVTDEFNYVYSPTGKLQYRVYKNPNTWRKYENGSSSYGSHDSIGTTYKDQVYEYDELDRLVVIKNYSLYDDPNRENPVAVGRTEYEYEGTNISKTSHISRDGSSRVLQYKYDDQNRLVSEYCCSENIVNAAISRKYQYDGNSIAQLDYSENFQPEQRKEFVVTFEYKFDRFKNWTTILKKVNGVPLYRWVRKITYY